MMKTHECIIIGAGAAGIGVALKLQELGVECMILESQTIGASFKKWNKETRFITPSFPSNAFGQVDLNSIDYRSSPGFFHMKEHMSGKEYVQYLETIVKMYNLEIYENEKVFGIEKRKDTFCIKSEKKKNIIVSMSFLLWENLVSPKMEILLVLKMQFIAHKYWTMRDILLRRIL